MKKKLPLHSKILLGIGLGMLWGFVSRWLELDPTITIYYLKPLGSIFMNLLLMVAIPLVLVSLITGIANLGDVAGLSKMGGKAIAIYMLTTTIAITIGLLVGNVFKPGTRLPETTRQTFEQKMQETAQNKIERAEQVAERQPLQPLIDIVPPNITRALSDNTSMLQVVFFAMLFGIALLKVPHEHSASVLKVITGLNHTIIKIIDLIMIFAPVGVFGLISAFIVETQDPELLTGVLMYAVAVLVGLLILMFLVYPALLLIFSNMPLGRFFQGIRPALLLAFSTSSSSATLPVTLKNCEENLKIPEQVTGFVLPLGATINMDGTSLYQGVAAVFIAQVFNMDLSIGEQVTVLMTALLASIGTAGVPGAGMVMLIIVLRSVGIPLEGIALILAPDRLLDMCRTVVNVTGDATVASIVAKGHVDRSET